MPDSLSITMYSIQVGICEAAVTHGEQGEAFYRLQVE